MIIVKKKRGSVSPYKDERDVIFFDTGHTDSKEKFDLNHRLWFVWVIYKVTLIIDCKSQYKNLSTVTNLVIIDNGMTIFSLFFPGIFIVT